MQQRILLLQPEEILHANVESIPDLARYLEHIQAEIQHYLIEQQTGFVVFAVHANGEQRFWFDFKPELPKDVELLLKRALDNIMPFDVYDGVILATVQCYHGEPEMGFPNPTEWKNAEKANGISLGELVLSLW